MNDATSLRVGIIGANAVAGWGRESHVPAVQSVAGLALTAVGTQRQETADAAAAAFGASKAYGDALALTRDPEIDIVSVVVRLPAHRALVKSALENRKHVYCEWPLGLGTSETEELAAIARQSGVKTVIGLQSRGDAAVQRARSLVVSGALGRIVRVRVRSTVAAWGPSLGEDYRYLNDPATGVNLFSIQGAHTLDLVIAILGRFTNIGGLLSTTYPLIQIGDGPQRVERLTPDHLLFYGQLEKNAPITGEVTHVSGDEQPFLLEIVGEDGVLELLGGAPRGAQAGRYALRLNNEPVGIAHGGGDGLSEAAVGVAGLYTKLRNDISNDTSTAPNFDHAARLSQLVDLLETSSDDGCRRHTDDWPQAL